MYVAKWSDQILNFVVFISFLKQKARTRTRCTPIFLTRHAYVGEVFFLRALLKNRAARSFEDLLWVDGKRYETFEAAASAAHLFEGHNAYDETMREAVARLGESQFSPHQLRLLFVQLILDGASNPRIFLDRFAIHLALDFIGRNTSCSCAFLHRVCLF